MKVKKTAKCPASASIDSTKVIKKKNKKKVKSLVQKLSTNSEVTEMVEPASGVAATTLSPKNNKRKKKNKNKKNKSEKPVDNGSIGSSSNSKELQVNNKSINSKNPLDNTLKVSNTHPATDNTSTDAPPMTKKAQKKNKRANSQASAGNASAAKDKKRRRAKTKESGIPESNEEKEQRTIFVGNVSTTTTRKNLARFFSKYGKVEAVRLRCAAVPTPGTPKRQAIITNKFHEKRSSLSAYVRFTEKAMVEAALKANGAQLDQKHLHVDSSQGCTDRNTKLAVFIGNLAFEAEEETLRSHFASCGEIESVRIVRDNKMASGKGFGYVNFVSEDAVEMALQLDGQVFMHRQLRVQRCTKQGKKRSKPSFKTQGKKGLGFMKTKQTSPKSKKMQQSFAGKKMVETKKFKKMRAKAKFTKEDRKKKSIAHKLAGVK